jgi:hypothetical protein
MPRRHARRFDRLLRDHGPGAIVKKLGNIGRDLREYSLDTVKTFYQGGAAAGYRVYSTISALEG